VVLSLGGHDDTPAWGRNVVELALGEDYETLAWVENGAELDLGKEDDMERP
jgi:hypothetical protein